MKDDDDYDYNSELLLGGLVIAAGLIYVSQNKKPPKVEQDLIGKAVVITGGNSGIGAATAKILNSRGADIFIGCRNTQGGESLCNSFDNKRCHVSKLDFNDWNSIDTFSKSVNEYYGKKGIDVLINNAGAMINEADKDTNYNIDKSMLVNHLGPIALSDKLMPSLLLTSKSKSNSLPRIVNVGSRLEKSAIAPIDYNNNTIKEWLQTSPLPYSTFSAYANSKVAMTASTYALAKTNDKVIATVVTPGMVHTSLSRFIPSWQQWLSWPLRKMMLRTPDQGAASVIHAAVNKDVSSSKYYSSDKKGNISEIESSTLSQDENFQQKILQVSREIIRELDKKK